MVNEQTLFLKIWSSLLYGLLSSCVLNSFKLVIHSACLSICCHGYGTNVDILSVPSYAWSLTCAYHIFVSSVLCNIVNLILWTMRFLPKTLKWARIVLKWSQIGTPGMKYRTKSIVHYRLRTRFDLECKHAFHTSRNLVLEV